MINVAPIFLNCFSRGGSNILWNLFLTHPNLCSPIQETIQIFRFDRYGVSWAGLRAAVSSRQRRLFDQWHLRPRHEVPSGTQQYIDHVLYEWKLKTLSDEEMKYKYENEVYEYAEVEQTRLVAKNNNGLVFLSDVLSTMYPDVTFIALVRDPVALYESHKRRQITESPSQFAGFYNSIACRMLEDSERFSRYHIVCFEELLAEPLGMMRQLYAWAGLDFGRIHKVRLKAKPHLHANGSHTTPYVSGRHYWFEPEELCQILEPKVNVYQRQQLSDLEQEHVRELTSEVRMRLGYQ